LRIISGTLKGRRLVAPRGMATRPTADRIKESVFNILAGDIQNRHVLDLFAGTGALGIEALSRGAACAVFIDRAKPALAALQRNIRDLRLEAQTRVIHWNILSNLNCLIPYRHRFDLVFMDPPYESDAVTGTLSALTACQALARGARVVIEHSVRESIAFPTEAMTLVDQRRFGTTLVSFIDSML
jgi:16S rRNA (guanine966-N2)-methyltransferase